MKKWIKLILVSIICWIILTDTALYIYNLTAGNDKTDCMITYVREYYPHGDIYGFDTGWTHIDKKDIEYLDKIWEANGCFMSTWNLRYDFMNTHYCFTTRFYELFR